MTQKINPQKTGNGPDFLCIGMQKAGATFIHECLQNLDGFQLPLYKEIHHFDKTCDFFGMARQDNKVVPRNRKGSAFKIPLDGDRRAILTRALGDEVENYAALVGLAFVHAGRLNRRQLL